jgi:hypothetical protein
MTLINERSGWGTMTMAGLLVLAGVLLGSCYTNEKDRQEGEALHRMLNARDSQRVVEEMTFHYREDVDMCFGVSRRPGSGGAARYDITQVDCTILVRMRSSPPAPPPSLEGLHGSL